MSFRLSDGLPKRGRDCDQSQRLPCAPVALAPKVARSYDVVSNFGRGERTEQIAGAGGEIVEVGYRVDLRPACPDCRRLKPGPEQN